MPRAYAVQIYADFAGYTDIAIGIRAPARLQVPAELRLPVRRRLAAGLLAPVALLTLSRWLRDYLYIPLGGSRRGPAIAYRNLLLTMLLGGLWHGAGWTFVAWGLIHGLGLCAERFWRERHGTKPQESFTVGRLPLAAWSRSSASRGSSSGRRRSASPGT